jgi:hypothetical protein
LTELSLAEGRNATERRQSVLQIAAPSVRSSNRFSMLSVLSMNKMNEKRDFDRKIDTQVDIKLDQINVDGIYRPDDTVKGVIVLKGAKVEEKVLKQVKVKVIGEATL